MRGRSRQSRPMRVLHPDNDFIQSVRASTPTCWAGWASTRPGPCLGGRTALGSVERRPPVSTGSGAHPGRAGREPALSWTDLPPRYSTRRPWLGDGTANIRVMGWVTLLFYSFNGRILGSSSSSRPSSPSSGGGRPDSRPSSPSSGGSRPSYRPPSPPSSGGGRPDSRPSSPPISGRPNSRAQPAGPPARTKYAISWEEKTKQWIVSPLAGRPSYTVRSSANTSSKCPADREEETWTVSAPGGSRGAVRVKCSPGY